MRERLTYRFLTQLIGAIVAFMIVVIKIVKIPITINGTTLEPGDVESIILAASGVLAVVVPLFIPDSNKPIFSSKDSPLSEKTRTDNRQRILDKVESIWITGYLDHVLNEMTALRLEMRFIEPKKVLERVGMTDEDLPDSGAILSAFNDLGRRLVILGEPGAGKTVTLLQLCRELISEARKDAKKPIPVVLALSSWATFAKNLSEKEKKLSFEGWLRQEVREKYGVSKKVADDLVVGEQLLYLLDGLDEVAEAQRDACLQAIKQFVEVERPVNYMICCRRQEFTELATHLKITGEVILQPLDDLQIGEYLSSDDFGGLARIWAESATLREFGRIPFMLNTIAVVTRDKSERQIRLEIESLDDPVQLRDELLEAYVDGRLRATSNHDYPDLRQTRERLKWLAKKLVHYKNPDFYIDTLDTDWLDPHQKRSQQRFFYMLLLEAAIVYPVLLGGAGVTVVIGLTVLIYNTTDVGQRSGTVFAIEFLVSFLLGGGLAFFLAFKASGWIMDTINRKFLSRVLLALEGNVPYRYYDRFLDYGAEMVILRKVGKGYRFVHNYLLQYLASAAFVPEAVVAPPEN